MIVCFAFGLLLAKNTKLPPNSYQLLNAIIVNIALPALTLLHVHRLVITEEIALAALMPWVLFIVGALFFFVIGKACHLSRDTLAALTLVGGLGNTSFVGVPMVEALHGRSGIPLALIIDQAGTYLVLSTLGMLAIALYTAEKKTVRSVVLKVGSFPPFIALCVAIILIDTTYPSWLETTLQRLGDLVAPLALMSVGLQLRFAGLERNSKALAIGLGYKLMICPALILAAFYFSGVSVASAAGHVILLESAMGPQIGAGIVASQHQLNPNLVTLMLGIGIPLSLITVPLWSSGFQYAGI